MPCARSTACSLLTLTGEVSENRPSNRGELPFEGILAQQSPASGRRRGCRARRRGPRRIAIGEREHPKAREQSPLKALMEKGTHPYGMQTFQMAISPAALRPDHRRAGRRRGHRRLTRISGCGSVVRGSCGSMTRVARQTIGATDDQEDENRGQQQPRCETRAGRGRPATTSWTVTSPRGRRWRRAPRSSRARATR